MILRSRFAASLFISVVSSCSVDSAQLISPKAEWKVEGHFSRNGVYPTTPSNRASRSLPPSDFWGSWTGKDEDTGTLTSPPFSAPAILDMFVAGYPGQPEMRIVLQAEDTGRTLPLRFAKAINPSERWQEMFWHLPSDWHGRMVKLVVEDRATTFYGWVGVSAPRASTWLTLWARQSRDFYLPLCYSCDFVLLFLPGLACASVLLSRRTFTPVALVITIVTGAATFGYLAFWAYLASKTVGMLLSYIVLLASTIVLSLNVYRWPQVRRAFRSLTVPFGLLWLVGIFYLSVFYVAFDPFVIGADYADALFFHDVRPGDNLIPFIFANKFYNHEPLHPFCCGDWLSSDRPPLQSGIFLLQRPLKLLGLPGLNYQVMGTALQCCWILGVWALLTTLRVRLRRILQVLGLLVFSGFFFYNSVYVWPKLLAATFLLFLWSIIAEVLQNRRPTTRLETCLAALCFGLAMLAHPGSAFSIPALVLVLLVRIRRFVPLKELAVAAGLTAALLVPWMAYQRFYDPPGNRLPKMHLAGVNPIDSRSTGQAVLDAYAHLSFSTAVQYKWRNLATVIGPRPFDIAGVNTARVLAGRPAPEYDTETERVAQREYIWNAIGVVNIGWLAVVPCLLLRKKPGLPYAGLMILFSLLNLIVWSIAMFWPEQTITALSSYLEIVFLSIALIGYLLALPPITGALLFLLQLFNFFTVWVYSLPTNSRVPGQSGIGPILRLPILSFAIACGAALLYVFGRSFLERTEETITRASESG